MFSVKNGEIKGSLDWVQTSDYDLMGIVLSELDIVVEVDLCSDRLSSKELAKMYTEYSMELKNVKKFETR